MCRAKQAACMKEFSRVYIPRGVTGKQRQSWTRRTEDKQNALKITGRFEDKNIRWRDRGPICMYPEQTPFLSERMETAGQADWAVCWLVSTPQGSDGPQADSDRICCCCFLIILINYRLPLHASYRTAFHFQAQNAKSEWALSSTSLQWLTSATGGAWRFRWSWGGEEGYFVVSFSRWAWWRVLAFKVSNRILERVSEYLQEVTPVTQRLVSFNCALKRW